VKSLLPVLAAGGTFAAAAILGLLAGIAAAGHFGNPLYVPAGLALGAAAGGVAALNLIVRGLQ
jgi:hypothetical protein